MNMLVTLEQLEQAIPGSSDRKRIAIVRELNERMKLGEITSSKRIAAFIAHFAYDSENLHILPNIEEYFTKWRKEYCNQLADIDSFSEIGRRIRPKLEGIECRKANWKLCKKVFSDELEKLV
jgi:predicted chitinase